MMIQNSLGYESCAEPPPWYHIYIHVRLDSFSVGRNDTTVTVTFQVDIIVLQQYPTPNNDLPYDQGLTGRPFLTGSWYDMQALYAVQNLFWAVGTF